MSDAEEVRTASAKGKRLRIVAACLVAVGLLVGTTFALLAKAQSDRNEKNAEDYAAACYQTTITDAVVGGGTMGCSGANEESIVLEVSLALAGLALVIAGGGIYVADWVRREPGS